MKLLFFDLETTGLDSSKHGIHQIAGIIVINNEKVKSFNFKVQPVKGKLVSQEALAIAKVIVDTLRTYPTIETVFSQFIEMLSEYVDRFDSTDKLFLCGYNNASFDNQFLREWFISNGDKYFGSWFWSNSFDVMVLATPTLAHVRTKMENFKLHTVAKHMGIEVAQDNLHDANYDIEITYEIFKKCCPMISETPDERSVATAAQ